MHVGASSGADEEGRFLLSSTGGRKCHHQMSG